MYLLCLKIKHLTFIALRNRCDDRSLKGKHKHEQQMLLFLFCFVLHITNQIHITFCRNIRQCTLSRLDSENKNTHCCSVHFNLLPTWLISSSFSASSLQHCLTNESCMGCFQRKWLKCEFGMRGSEEEAEVSFA